jgi:MFS family permease
MSKTKSSNPASSFSALKDEPQYIKILIANAVNRLGDSIDLIAFEWIAYLLTGSAAWVAAIIAFNFIPNIFLAPFAGTLVERFNLKRIMVVADIFRVLIVAAEMVFLIIGILEPWMLILSTLAISSAEQFRVPTAQSIRVRLLPKEKFGVAIAANNTVTSVFQLVGVGVGGLLTAISPIVALAADALLITLSALMIYIVKGDFSPINKAKLTLKSYMHSLKDGFKYLKTKKGLLFLAFFGAGMNFTVQPLSTYMPSYIGDLLSLGSWGLSLFSAGCMLGQIFGSIIAPKLREKLGFRYSSFITGMTLCACMLLLWLVPQFNWGHIGNAIFITAVSFVFFTPVGVTMVIFSSLFFENVEDDYVARATGTFSAISNISIPASAFICAALAAYLPITIVFLIFVPVQFCLFSTVFFPKSIKKLDG